MPDDLKNLISGIVNMGVMLVVLLLISKLMPMFTPEKEKSKKVRETKPAELEEAKA
jgi:competence protein ComGC